ncbi:MAG: peroxiredoxin [Janthinobacterium lividum]
MPAPQIGELVEDFTLPDQDGLAVTLSNFLGKPVVLFFYPKADTPGCTVEACGFRDQFAQLEGAGAAVFGISRDTVKAQKKFKDKFALPYTLLADADQELIKRFDLLKQKTMYGKPVTGVERTTYVIGADGRLLHTFSNVKPQGHAEEVLALLGK